MDQLQGQILIASNELIAPSFARTIVLIAAHGDSGALGLILNRESDTPLEEIWEQVSDSACERSGNVRHGGPVGGSLMALHDQRELANLVVTDELFLATDLSAMQVLAGSDEGQALFYVGHSGWGPGQLENELAEGSWLLLPATAEHAFGDSDGLAVWKHCKIQAGRRRVRSIIDVRHVPEDPRLN